MTSATTLNIKLLECCHAIQRTHFTTFIFEPSSQFLFKKQTPFSPSSLSVKSKILPFKIVPFVARTSDWAQQEEGEERGSDYESDEVIEENVDGDGGVPEEGEDVDSYPKLPEEAKIFVGNLPSDVDSQELALLFDQAGVVQISEVICNRKTEQSRGFGFVTMSTVEEAEKAVEMFNRYDLNGRLLTVNKAAQKGSLSERVPRSSKLSFRIYVGNLPWQVDGARLEKVFSKHGTVVDAKVVYDRETGRSRGFGFVTMSTETERNDAIAALDGQNLDGRAIRVNAAAEKPKLNAF